MQRSRLARAQVGVELMGGVERADDARVPADGVDALNARASAWLRSGYCARRREAAAGSRLAVDSIAAAGTDGVLLAVEHIGAVTREEAATWRSRFAEARAEGEQIFGPVDPAVRHRAVAHLERLVAPLRPGEREAASPAFAAIAAYAKTGVLTSDEELAWQERVLAALGSPPLRPAHCTQRDLLEVVPGPAQRHDGVRITSVMLYADGVVLYWHQADRWSEAPPTPRLWSSDDIEASCDASHPHELNDDAGTRYLGHGRPYLGLSGGGWVVRFGISAFTPRVPQAARRLGVPLRDGRVEIELVQR